MSKHRRKSHECKNCGYTWPSAPDEFCPSCGQENTDLNIPLKHWILEFIEAIFHVDGKLGVTLKYLFLKPGKMSVEFTEGRRMKFIPPARLYIFVSFFFFLALSTMHYDDALTGVVDLTEPELDKPWEEVSINVFGENTIGLTGLNASRREVRRAYLKGTEALDSLFARGGLQFDGSMERGFWHQAAKIETLGPSTFREKLMKLFSLGAFLLMPGICRIARAVLPPAHVVHGTRGIVGSFAHPAVYRFHLIHRSHSPRSGMVVLLNRVLSGSDALSQSAQFLRQSLAGCRVAVYPAHRDLSASPPRFPDWSGDADVCVGVRVFSPRRHEAIKVHEVK
jgi:hypothetical protein